MNDKKVGLNVSAAPKIRAQFEHFFIHSESLKIPETGEMPPHIARHITAPEIGIKRYEIRWEIISLAPSRSELKPLEATVLPTESIIPE